ncbi:hypothetical protein D3C80_1550760 [compost metagenome]
MCIARDELQEDFFGVICLSDLRDLLFPIHHITEHPPDSTAHALALDTIGCHREQPYLSQIVLKPEQ